MPPTPDETLRTLGRTMRNARVARGLTQQRLSKLASVSRSQIAAIEKGGNVSLRFFLTLAAHLQLPVFPTLADPSGAGDARAPRANAYEMIRALELLGLLVHFMRELSVDVILPPSSRGEVRDTPALEEFLSHHAPDYADIAEKLSRNFARPVPRPAAPERAVAAPQRRKGLAR